MSKNKVLMFAYHFPPQGGGGVQRSAYFAHHLPSFGWQPVVVSSPLLKDYVQDHSLLRLIPGDIRVTRTRALRIDSLISRLNRTWFWRLSRVLQKTVIIDTELGWVPFAVNAGLKQIRSESSIRLIYTTAPPFSANLIGLRLHRITGIPWVADFRDPWSQSALEYREGAAHNRARDRRLEQRILTSASHVIVNTDWNKRKLLEDFELARTGVSVINNGFDESSFRNAEARTPPPSQNGSFRLLFVGSAYGDYHPGPILDALSSEARGHPRGTFELQCIGRSATWAESWRSLLESAGVRVNVYSYIPHEKLIEHYLRAHAVIFGYPSKVDYSLPGKIFEYLRSGRPIIATGASESQTADLLRETHSGRVFHPDDQESIRRYIKALLEKWKSGGGLEGASMEAIMRFERKALSRELASIFNRIGSCGSCMPVER
jgi:glycosyltransferase involved in cell wall biosynthesis